MDTRTFFDIMGAAPAAVTVVTTVDRAGRPHGLTAAAVCSVSADPPILLVCIDLRSRTLPAIRERGEFAVNFLAGEHPEVARRFASPVADRFESLDWTPGTLGVPLLSGVALAYAECRLTSEQVVGDHLVLFGRVVDGQAPGPRTRPLMYFRHRFGPWEGQVDDGRPGPSPQAPGASVRPAELAAVLGGVQRAGMGTRS
jgi:flavin reductase (DIM6/NTAB) family NADH-FMN oxidoreductase RutF